MEHKDIKDFGKLIGEFITRYMTMIRCASQQCSKEIIKAAADKDLIEKYSKFNLEQHKPTKIKMLFELSDNSIMYDINICAVKNCKKFVKDVLKSFDSYLNLIPKPITRKNRQQISARFFCLRRRFCFSGWRSLRQARSQCRICKIR